MTGACGVGWGLLNEASHTFLTHLCHWRQGFPQNGVPLLDAQTQWGEQKLCHRPQATEYWDIEKLLIAVDENVAKTTSLVHYITSVTMVDMATLMEAHLHDCCPMGPCN